MREALRIKNISFDDKEVYIRDCIDDFLFHVEIMEQAIKNELIEFKDIQFPMEYYADAIIKNDLNTSLNKFITEYKYSNAEHFFLRFKNHQPTVIK